MSDVLTQAATKRVLALFGPLAQIELAASRLGRECATPAARELVASVRAAVREIDAGVSDALVWLAPTSATASEQVDLTPTLHDLALRFGPVLAARERVLRVLCDDGRPAIGDPVYVRRIAVCLLRTSASLAGPGGTVTLGVTRDATRVGVETIWRRASDTGAATAGVRQAPHHAGDASSIVEAIERIEAVCASGGGVLEQCDQEDGGQLVVWLSDASESAATRGTEASWSAF